MTTAYHRFGFEFGPGLAYATVQTRHYVYEFTREGEALYKAESEEISNMLPDEKSPGLGTHQAI